MKVEVKARSEGSKRPKVDGSKTIKMDDTKTKNWAVIRDESRRSKNDPRIKSMLVTEIGDKFGMLVKSQVTN